MIAKGIDIDLLKRFEHGLNPKAPTKPSGLDWLGEIPRHWDVLRLKYVGRIGNGSTPNVDN